MKGIEYKLNIKREHKTYGPNNELLRPILSSKKRIFEISYKSGFGKTFLLNLIAYALEANKLGDEYILPSLKDSVSRYNNYEYYDLTYNIVLELPDGRNLILKKDNEENKKVIQYENQPPINHHSLHQRVTVLYDVPSNPSERLNGVIKDLSIWNENIRAKIKTHTDFLNDLKKELDNERDEKKIAQYKEQVGKLDSKIRSESKLLEQKKDILENLKLINNLESLQEILKTLQSLDSRIEDNSKKLKNIQKPSTSSTQDLEKLKKLRSDFFKENKLYAETVNHLNKIVSSNEELVRYINRTSALKTDYKYIIDKSDLEEIFNLDDHITIVARLKKGLEYFKNMINSFIQEERTGERFKLNEGLQDFLKLIEKFKEADSIEILENITRNDENILRVKINKVLSENFITSYTLITEFLKTSYKELRKSLENAERINKQIQKENRKRGIKSSEKEYTKIETRLVTDKKERNNQFSEKEKLKNTCFNLMKISDITQLENHRGLTDFIYNYKSRTDKKNLEDIQSSIDKLQKEVEGIQQNLENTQKQRVHFEIRYQQENNRKSVQYSEKDKNKIEKIIRQLQFAISNLTTFGDIITNINNGDLSRYQEEEDKGFMKVAGRIIAYSMDNKLLWSNGEYIGLYSYDLLNQSFQCDNDIVIHKDDLSTGLSSANYLKQRIENVKGDYVVILLDEIGNMSNDILQEVLKSIKKIEEEDRLVLALLTHPNTNHINIVEH